MDIGSAAYTEFDMSPDVVGYMTENIELLDYQMGLIHSHNSMATFFSGTDTATLKEEGLDRNHFVSLIVNNAGKYTAGITRKVKSNKAITENFSYPTYGDSKIEDQKSYTIEEEVIEWFNLDIVFEKPQNSFQEDLKNRLEEIKKSKEEQKKEQSIAINTTYQYPKYYQQSLFPEQQENKKQVQTAIDTPVGRANQSVKTYNSYNTDPYYFSNSLEDSVFDTPYGTISCEPELIQELVRQLITGSIIINNSSKINIVEWSKNMESLYDKRFGTGDFGMKLFNAWADTYVEYLCWYTESTELSPMKFADEDIAAFIAYDMVKVLKELPSNKYIDAYIVLLENHII